MRAFLRVLLFLLIGPFIGLLVLSLAIGLWTLVTSGSMRDFTFGPELLAPGILLISYTVGGIPALLTGVASIFVMRWSAGFAGWGITAIVGGAISLVGALFLFGPGMSTGGQDNQIIVIMVLAGAVAGFVCAALFDGIATLFHRSRAAA